MCDDKTNNKTNYYNWGNYDTKTKQYSNIINDDN